ncbi:hypothetical protein GCM10011316_07720 [Roseibium aquae]|uniref:Uncharacterized protein n=1 Tax=Roseibium aquae TaxID=1323746 RepID=A0A916TAQ1_9HYPH|nr:hypothetical protein [Roseibium aquae]GGB38114.1 hypothetical protein GCM10011316_07720 [Roseibium aquae]
MTETEGDPASKPIKVHLVHSTDGRARLRLVRPVTRARLEDVCEALARMPGVTRSLARPNTGSLIVEADLKKNALADLLAACSAIKIVPKMPSPPLGASLQFGLLRADQAITQRSGGQLNLHTALGALLLVLSIVQLARGRIVGPAATLLVNALSLLENGGPNRR